MKSKDSNSEKSLSYQKKDGRGPARPSLFWYDNDKDLKVMTLISCPVLHIKLSHKHAILVDWKAIV